MKKNLSAEIKKACTQEEKIVLILNDTYELLCERLPELPRPAPNAPESSERGKEPARPIESYTENELATIKEAAYLLGVSRWKIDDMRQKGELTTLEKGGQVRLIRKEVDEAKVWYSIPRGKI